MASILGAVGFPEAAAYVSAKHGLLGLTQNAALEYSAQGIRTNAIGPAFIRTPLIKGMEEAVLPLHPIGRLGEPEEVAELVLFLPRRVRRSSPAHISRSTEATSLAERRPHAALPPEAAAVARVGAPRWGSSRSRSPGTERTESERVSFRMWRYDRRAHARCA